MLKLHPGQNKVWEALENPEIREIGFVGGIQGGKTTIGGLAMMKKYREWMIKYPGCNFLVAADNYKTLSQATIPTFLKVFTKQLGKYVGGSREEFVLKRGGKVFFRTGTDPNSAEGIPDCAFAWMDEAGKCSRLFKINVLGRVARLQGQVLYTSTPYAMNWLYSEVEKPFYSGERKDIAFIRFKSVDNPSFPHEEFERQRAILDPKTFERKYLGIHSRMEGLVYEITDQNYTSTFIPNARTRTFAGVDFGFTQGHEFALSVRAITEHGEHIAVSTFKKAGLDPNAQVMLAKAKMEMHGIETFYCDPARPDMIALFNKAGIPAVAFHIGKEDFKKIMPGISKHNELIRSGKYKILRGVNPDLEDEYETYHYPEFEEGKVIREEPVKLNDNLMDSERYVTIGTMHIQFKAIPETYLGRAKGFQDKFDPRKIRKTGGWDSY